jgi:hypothetical protein
MTDEQKKIFDSTFEMYSLSWQQFNERRSYEFKVSLTFWTALAAAVAGSLHLSILPAIPGGRFTLLLIAISSLSLHGIWCFGIGRAQRAERKIALFYERKLQNLIKAEFDTELNDFLSRLRTTMGLLKNWTYIFQLGVTALLAAALVVTNWNRFEQRSYSEVWLLLILIIVMPTLAATYIWWQKRRRSKK